MSHILEAKTSICFVVKNEAGQRSEVLLDQAYAMLRQAVEIVAAEHGVCNVPYRSHNRARSVEDYFLDWGGQEQRTHTPARTGREVVKAEPVKLGVFSPKLPRGIGMFINPETGELSPVGDSYDCTADYNAMIGQIAQVYAAIQFQSVLAEIGYSVNISETDRRVVLEAVSYAA